MVHHRDFRLAGGLAALAALWLVGCRPATTPGSEPPNASSGTDPSGLSGKITVLVPCGQLGPYMDAKALFRDKHPNVEIEQRQENINVLLHLIEDGKIPEADVFLDMGDTVVQKLLKSGHLLQGTERAYAQNYLALIVPKGNPAGIHTFTDLGNPKVKAIALAEPTENSNGQYAVEALKKAGLWDKLEKAGKIVTTPKPAELKGMVGQRKVDAAFIYGPCAHEAAKGEDKPANSLPKKTEMIGNVPEDLYTPFYCTGAVLAGSDNPEAAKAFLEFLTTDEASECWQNWYFGPTKEKAERKAEAILVHCGAGIRPPMDELAELFEKRTGTPVDLAYKGSGCLLADIEFSRKGDLYMPGEEQYMDQAKKKGFVVESLPVAKMTTVIITPPGQEEVKTLQDLAKPGLKLGLGAAPQTAVGVAAKHVLEKAGLWDAVTPNVTMNALNVIELADSIKLGGLDAAIVWDATAFLVRNDARTVEIDPQYACTTVIPCGTLKFSRHPDKAQLFLDLAVSTEGAAVFAKHGYGAVSRAHRET